VVTEMLGDDAIISSDFGGNPPYEKDEGGRTHLLQALGWRRPTCCRDRRQSNNTDIFETLRAIADALREHFSAAGATPLYIRSAVGRAQFRARLLRAARHLRSLGLPYRIFGFDSDDERSDPVCEAADAWMKAAAAAGARFRAAPSAPHCAQ